MREQYEKQVALLLDVLPFVAKSEAFALKGGTAINFFYLDCPRLSVDIDLHYLPVNDRESALAEIAANMQAIATSIEQAYPETNVKMDTNTLNAVVARRGTQIKIEPNSVIRGHFLPVEQKALSPYLEQKYGRAVAVPCIAKQELYAGKLCAALQRQHPRDLFDVQLFLQHNDLSTEMMDVFIIYLISQGKPIHEELNPNLKDVATLYHKQFVGMTREDVEIDQLLEVQSTLPQRIVAALTDKHREFLIGFKQGNPDWSLLPFPDIESLPAVHWKQQNLGKMDNAKREQTIKKLQQIFLKIPYKQSQALQKTEKEQAVSLTPQEQLTEEIIGALIERGLIGKTKEQQTKKQFSTGQLKREDWSLLIELASAKTAEGDTND